MNKMLSKKDRVLIKVLRVEKGYGAKIIMTEFLGRNFSLASVKRLLHQTDRPSLQTARVCRPQVRQWSTSHCTRCGTKPRTRQLHCFQLRHPTSDFIGPQYWPPNSPDLNPVDYAVWGILQEQVYRCWIRDVDHLKERLIAEWRRFDQNIIDIAVNQWRERLCGCVRENGGHFEDQN